MLYVFFGKDAITVREKAFAQMGTLTTDALAIVRVTDEEYCEGMLAAFAEGVSLFGEIQVILLDTPSSDAVFNEAVLMNAEVLAQSQNHFVIIEESLLAPQKKIYTAHAQKIEECQGDTVAKFNTFALTDAFLKRDKKLLWMLYSQAKEAGVSNEEIAGILFWQIKLLRVVEKTKNSEASGQKPFVYNKAKRALMNFKKGELHTLSRTLVQLYHDGHGGKVDMGNALEQWVLGV